MCLVVATNSTIFWVRFVGLVQGQSDPHYLPEFIYFIIKSPHLEGGDLADHLKSSRVANYQGLLELRMRISRYLCVNGSAHLIQVL